MKCEICNIKIKKTLIDLGNQPIPDNLSSNEKISLKKKKFKTNIKYCSKCITAYQTHTIKKEELYTKNYSYRASNTKDVVNGLKNLASEIKKKTLKKTNCKILDIGCNDGSLLNFFYEKKFKTYGIEPTDAYKDCKKKHKIYNKYFEKSTAIKFIKENGYPDVIVFTNVFAHIEDLKSLIFSLKILIEKETLVVIENHYLISVIKRFQFDTFYHEHLRTYSLNSFYYIGKMLNLNIVDFKFPKRYGGNIRIFFQKKKKYNSRLKLSIVKEKKFFNKIKNKFLIYLENWKVKNKIKFQILNKKFGPLYAKSYPARASIIINYLNLNKNNIKNIYEQNFSKKVNKFVPGTNIKIIADKNLKKINQNIPIINFSWHISGEIKKYIRNNGIKNKIINIINNKYF